MTQTPVMPLPLVRLKTERRSNHPWIFQKMVERPGERIVPGSLVEVHGVDGEFIGRGMLNMQAPMAIRLLSEKPDEVIDAHWLAEKVADAVHLRRDIYRLDAVTDSYRVIHAEGDGLSGLIVDRFGDVLVVCFYSAGMWRLQHWVFDALLTQARQSDDGQVIFSAVAPTQVAADALRRLTDGMAVLPLAYLDRKTHRSDAGPEAHAIVDVRQTALQAAVVKALELIQSIP